MAHDMYTSWFIYMETCCMLTLFFTPIKCEFDYLKYVFYECEELEIDQPEDVSDTLTFNVRYMINEVYESYPTRPTSSKVSNRFQGNVGCALPPTLYTNLACKFCLTIVMGRMFNTLCVNKIGGKYHAMGCWLEYRYKPRIRDVCPAPPNALNR